MTGISWPTVAASTALAAGVSAFVALAADYFARPGLDARKERLLERHRARRDFATAANRVLILASSLADPGLAVPPDLRDLFEQERDRMRADIEVAGRDMAAKMPLFMLYLRPEALRSPAARFAGRVIGIATSPKTHDQAAHELVAISSPIVDYFYTPRWQRRARHRALANAHDLLMI